MKTSFNRNNEENPDPLGAPEADLSVYYSGTDDPQIENDLEELQNRITNFIDQYKGNMAQITAADLPQMFGEYDNLLALSEKLDIYTYLLNAKDKNLYATFTNWLNEQTASLTRPLSFFAKEINTLDENDLHSKMRESPELKRYDYLIDRFRRHKPYQLTDEEEKALTDITPASSEPLALDAPPQWVSLFDKMQSLPRNYVYTSPTKHTQRIIGETQLRRLMGSSNRSTKSAAYEAYEQKLQEDLPVKAHILNEIIRHKNVIDAKRGYPTPVSSRNLANNVEDEIIDVFASTITACYPRTSHRYYDLKRREFGMEALKHYDLHKPLIQGAGTSSIPFQTAKDIVLESIESFSPPMAEIALEFFDENRIDARPTAGKKSGAFNHWGSILAKSFTFMNYTGKQKDITTLGHETGHGVHAVAAANATRSQSAVTPSLVLAETGSAFFERLVFEYQYQNEENPLERLHLQAQYMDASISLITGPMAFFEFEKEIHERHKEGELTPEELNAVFLEKRQEALGPAVDLDEGAALYWSERSHIFRTPFYTYSYPFGECLTRALYQKYEEAEDKADFADKFFSILEAGNTKHHSELLAPLGIDLTDPAFWENAMISIEKDLDRLEEALHAHQTLQAVPEQDNSPAP